MPERRPSLPRPAKCVLACPGRGCARRVRPRPVSTQMSEARNEPSRARGAPRLPVATGGGGNRYALDASAPGTASSLAFGLTPDGRSPSVFPAPQARRRGDRQQALRLLDEVKERLARTRAFSALEERLPVISSCRDEGPKMVRPGLELRRCPLRCGKNGIPLAPPSASLATERPCVQGLWHGASRTRTGDLLGAIQALSQLSYSPARA